MNFITIDIEVRPYKERTKEEDEMDALSKKVLRELNVDSTEDNENDDYLGDPIWCPTEYNKEWLKNNIAWLHSGLNNPEYTVIYFSLEDFVVTNLNKQKLLQLLEEL